MNYIKAICHTNLDDYVCPITVFVVLPRIGESVTCFKKGMPMELKICKICHCQVENNGFLQPYILVELHN